MNQNSRVIKFPCRGRFAKGPRPPMTTDRQARGQAWITHIRQMLEDASE